MFNYERPLLSRRQGSVEPQQERIPNLEDLSLKSLRPEEIRPPEISPELPVLSSEEPTSPLLCAEERGVEFEEERMPRVAEPREESALESLSTEPEGEKSLRQEIDKEEIIAKETLIESAPQRKRDFKPEKLGIIFSTDPNLEIKAKIKIKIKSTSLPPEAPGNMVVCPTSRRWGEGDQLGPLPQMVFSVQQALRNEGMSDSSWMILSDESRQPDIDALRTTGLQQSLGQVDKQTPLFILSPELQARVLDKIRERTGIGTEVLKVLLGQEGYSGQRQTIDVIAAALMTTSGYPLKLLTFDDDTRVPEERLEVKKEVLQQYNLEPLPNSQVVFVYEEGKLPPESFHRTRNEIGPLLRYLGMTVEKIRQEYPDIKTIYEPKDTIREMLERAEPGKPSQLVVTFEDRGKMAGLEGATIIAASAIKHGNPDLRAKEVVKRNFLAGLPTQELPLLSYPSGPNKPYVYIRNLGGVDSACLARYFNERTAFLPWWFVSSFDVSQATPLVSVHLRGDNEMLPLLLETTFSKTGEQYMYLGGLPTQVEHHRTPYGYRPALLEQAIASHLGGLAASEAVRRLKFDQITGIARLSLVDIEGDYRAPQDWVEAIFGDLIYLAEICTDKRRELSKMVEKEVDPQTLKELEDRRSRYEKIHKSLREKTGNFNIRVFSAYLTKEVHQQLIFYAKVVNAMPIVIEEVSKLIRQGKYPVLEAVSLSEPKTSYPSGASGVIYQ